MPGELSGQHNFPLEKSGDLVAAPVFAQFDRAPLMIQPLVRLWCGQRGFAEFPVVEIDGVVERHLFDAIECALEDFVGLIAAAAWVMRFAFHSRGSFINEMGLTPEPEERFGENGASMFRVMFAVAVFQVVIVAGKVECRRHGETG